MNKRNTLLIIICFSCLDFLYSQDNAIQNAINRNNIKLKQENLLSNEIETEKKAVFWKGWAVGFGYGLTQFDGDVRQYDHYPASQEKPEFSEVKSAVSLLLSKKMNVFYSLGAEILSGNFGGMRRNTEYAGYMMYDPYLNYEGNGDKFVASFKEFDLLANIDIANTVSYFIKTRRKNNFSFEGKLGIGYGIYNTVRRNLFSDTYIYSYGYEDEGANLVDSDYGSNKKGLFSAPSETVYIYGVCAKYKLNNSLDLKLDYTIRKGRTDKWDASIMNTQNGQDRFSFLSIGLAYNIGIQNNNEWESPIDGLKEDVGSLFAKVEGFTEDIDSDGVSDAFDKHNATPLGVAVDGAGVPLDVDMDNIPDYRDGDPFSNRGAQVDKYGVELDDDNDGIPNSQDLETSTPIGSMVNRFGINVTSINYYNGELNNLPSIYFLSGSSTVDMSNSNNISAIGLFLENNISIRLKVIGHTDKIGNEKFNKRLGLRRAQAVINYLVSNYNISEDRLIATTRGEEEPLSVTRKGSKDKLDKRKKTNIKLQSNRRVVFEIFR